MMMLAQQQDLEKRVSELEKKMAQQKAEEKQTFRFFWKDGLRFETADKAFSGHIGGRTFVHYIYQNYNDDRQIRAQQGAEGDHNEHDALFFRTARLEVEGTFYEHYEFKSEFDFAGGGNPTFKSVFLGLRDLNVCDVGSIDLRVGHTKEPIGLEELTSSRFITFTERSLPSLAFLPEYQPGFFLNSHWWNQVVTFAAAVTKRETTAKGLSSGTIQDGRWSFITRLTASPWYENEGKEVLHLGVGYRAGQQPAGGTAPAANRDGQITLSVRPEVSTIGAVFVTTPAIDINYWQIVDAELAIVYESFSVQAEFFYVPLSTDGPGDPEYTGYYVQASWFITGEHRVYKRSAGVFDRVRPIANFLDGWGAWEFKARYSFLDLSNGGFAGGTISDLTFGVNWYLNPNMRVMFDYIYTDLEDLGNAWAVAVRFQVDF
jgi:phosphate-selective porin OprO/OprP